MNEISALSQNAENLNQHYPSMLGKRHLREDYQTVSAFDLEHMHKIHQRFSGAGGLHPGSALDAIPGSLS